MATETYNGIHTVRIKDSEVRIDTPRHFWRPYLDRARNATIDAMVSGATAVQDGKTLSLTNYRGDLQLPSSVRTDIFFEGAVKISGTNPGGTVGYNHATVEGSLEPPKRYEAEMHPFFAAAKGIAEDSLYMGILVVPSLAALAAFKHFTGINMAEHPSWAPVLSAGAYFAFNPHDRRATLSSLAVFLGLTFGDDVLNLHSKGLDSFSIQDVWNTCWFGAGNIMGYIARKYSDGYKW